MLIFGVVLSRAPKEQRWKSIESFEHTAVPYKYGRQLRKKHRELLARSRRHENVAARMAVLAGYLRCAPMRESIL